MTNYDLTYFEKELAAMNLVLSDRQKRQFILYYELLTEWNKNINLTAITEFDDVIRKHFLDSLLIQNLKEHPEHGTVIDVGSGAGFPGIPLAIVYPNLEITLLDSLQKRVTFLNACKEQLELPNIHPVHERAEDAARQPDKREKYDYAVSRAVAALPTLCEYCLPFVKIGGSFIAYKSQKAEQETEDAKNALKILHGEISETKTMMLGDTDIERTILIINKTGRIPEKYPRKSGIPTKKPL